LQQRGADFVFGEQALLDHLSHVGAGELEAVGKARLDLGEVVALLLAHLAEDGVHVLLGGDDEPCAALAFGGQAFGDRLQVGHELGVSAMYWPTSSTKKLRRKSGGCLSSQPLTWFAKSSIETL
jgi:hypothetical protein